MEQRRVLRHRLVTSCDDNSSLIPTAFSDGADTCAPERGIKVTTMNDHFFADVDLPFHVWVRERSVGPGFRWVLREASQVRQPGGSAPGAVSVGGKPPTSKSS